MQVVVSSSGSIRTNGNDKNKDDVKVGVQAKENRGKGREIELTGDEKRLVEEVAQLLELDPDEVELNVPLVELGMDSMMLGQLQGIVSSDFTVDLESEELFTETCTLNLIFAMIKNGGCSPNFTKQEKDAAVIPIKEEEDEDRNPAPRKKPMSTFEVIFCFLLSWEEEKKKGGDK